MWWLSEWALSFEPGDSGSIPGICDSGLSPSSDCDVPENQPFDAIQVKCDDLIYLRLFWVEMRPSDWCGYFLVGQNHLMLTITHCFFSEPLPIHRTSTVRQLF